MPVPAQGALDHMVTPLPFWKPSWVLVPFCTLGTDLTDKTSFHLQPAGLGTLKIKFFVGNHLLCGELWTLLNTLQGSSGKTGTFRVLCALPSIVIFVSCALDWTLGAECLNEGQIFVEHSGKMFCKSSEVFVNQGGWCWLSQMSVKFSRSVLKGTRVLGRDWLSESRNDDRKMPLLGSGMWFWTERLFRGTEGWLLHLPWRTCPRFDSMPPVRVCNVGQGRVSSLKFVWAGSSWWPQCQAEGPVSTWSWARWARGCRGCVWPREVCEKLIN